MDRDKSGGNLSKTIGFPKTTPSSQSTSCDGLTLTTDICDTDTIKTVILTKLVYVAKLPFRNDGT